MDPVSVVGLVNALVGTLDVLGRSVMLLNGLRKRLKEADLTVNLLIGQLTAVKAALNQIHLWLDEGSFDDKNHYQLSIDLDSSLSSCDLLIETINDQISNLQWDEQDELKFISRARVVLEDARTKDCLVYLGNLVNCLSLLLVAFKCRTATDQKKLLEDRRSREVFGQIKEDSSSLIVMCDSGSLSSRRTTTTTNTSKYSMRFVFDGELLKHKAYQSTIRALMRRARNRDMAKDPAADKNPSELVAELQAEQETAKSRQVDKTLKKEASLMRRYGRSIILGLPGSRTAELAKTLALYDIVRQQGRDDRISKAARMSYESYINRYRVLIVKLIVQSLQAALNRLSDVDIGTRHHLEPYVQILCTLTDDMLTGTLPHDVITAITALCKSGVVQEKLVHSVPRPATSAYFFESIESILSPSYTPSRLDIAELAKQYFCATLQSQPMPEIDHFRLTEYTKTFHQIRKLAHVFQGIGLLIFVINLACYDEDEVNGPDATGNKMLQNIACLRFIVNSPYFRGCIILVELDSYAEFKRRLQRVPFTAAFSEYKGGNDANIALAYLISQLRQINTFANQGRSQQEQSAWVKSSRRTADILLDVHVLEEDDIIDASMISNSICDWVRYRALRDSGQM